MKINFFIHLVLSAFCCYSQTISRIDSLSFALNKAQTDTEKVNCYNNIAKYLIDNTIYDSASVYSGKALILARKCHPDFLRGVSKALYYEAKIKTYKSNYNEALHCHLESYKLDSSLNDRAGMSVNLDGMGLVFHYKAEYQKALSYYFKALQLDEQSKNKLLMARHLEYIGLVYGGFEDHKKALEFFQKALKINEELDDINGMAHNLKNIGQASWFLNDPKAREYYDKSLNLAEESKDISLQAGVLEDVGAMLAESNKYADALKYYLKAEEILKKSEGLDSRCVNAMDLGDLYLTMRKFRESLKYLSKAFSAAEQMKNNNRIKEVYFSLSNLYKEADINLPDIQSNRRVLSMEEMRLKALAYYQNYSDLKDSLFNSSQQRIIYQKEMDYQVQKRENENKMLAQQNQIQSLKLSNSRNVITGLILFLIVLASISILIFRQNKLRSNQRAIQLEQKLLRSQMNPHFIFNSLNSIHSVVLSGDAKTAAKYLASFSKLVRNILESSRFETISLEKEISLLRNYIDLQILRFENDIKYEIDIDTSLELESIQIPPMLTQPFIENALEHGLSNIDNPLLKVSFNKSDESLIVEVIDNGKGMLGSKNNNEHISMATTITRERLQLLNKGKSKKASYAIMEAFPLSENKGVKVVFDIPLQCLSA